ncbi:hypothetical protein [Nitrosomonas communis]|uniref:hypothetical protein n=1 Tax=Nitrosomonas communis TaxID=44574 RepID=UPI0026F0A528|nr:hypothetical protein [Nitrosomonas communis]MCO6428507.1 hypothetical protein [Nitrosomonas communis]
MRVLVYFRSGASQVFIVPRDILAVEFQRVAEAVGGCFHRVEFIQKKTKLQRLNTSY